MQLTVDTLAQPVSEPIGFGLPVTVAISGNVGFAQGLAIAHALIRRGLPGNVKDPSSRLPACAATIELGGNFLRCQNNDQKNPALS